VGREPDRLLVALRAARVDQGISQVALSVLMGTDPGSISHWEVGDTDMRLSSLRRYLDAIGKDVVVVDKPLLR
jgi:predicted transcriptional regulator